MSEAEELKKKGIELFCQKKFYEAMEAFTKLYNITNSAYALMLSARASFQYAISCLEDHRFESFETFSQNALGKYQKCAKYCNSEEITREATEKIQQIEEARRSVEKIKTDMKNLLKDEK